MPLPSLAFALIYSAVPALACKGKCQKACGPIVGSEQEIAEFERTTGKPFPNPLQVLKTRNLSCPHLNPFGRCGVYQNRPLICRLYGNVKRLQCPHGCVPERWLSEEESRALIEATFTA